MKRVCMILIALVTLCALLVLPASAAGSGSLTMSSASGLPGDTVTLSVNLANNPGLVTMTIRVKYDTSVLQLTGVSNTGLLVGAQLNSNYSSPYTISWVDGATTVNNTQTGTIATFTFKILDQAKAGSSVVTLQFVDSYDTDYNENQFSVTSGKVTVMCEHSYGAWEDAGNGQHSRSCTKCSQKEYENHNWNGIVTKQPTCATEGSMNRWCMNCDIFQTVSVPKSDEFHQYDDWSNAGNNHKRTCLLCLQEDTEDHNWDFGRRAKEPTCGEEGIKRYECYTCKATKEEKIPKTSGHSYGYWRTENSTDHKRTCSVCAREEVGQHTWDSGRTTRKATCKEEGVTTFYCTVCDGSRTESIPKLKTHKYDYSCDAECNVCGAIRDAAHRYDAAWHVDETGHWRSCLICWEKKDHALHTPGAAATETNAQSCTGCGYILQAALSHTHKYATTWTIDNNGHWYACSGCSEKRSYSAHDFINGCDKDCSICGYTRETAHKFTEEWITDGNRHWHICTGCNLKQEEAAHTPGAPATELRAQTCTVCDYELAPKLAVEAETEPAEETEETEATEATISGESEEELPTTIPTEIAEETEHTDASEATGDDGASFPWWIILVCAAAALVCIPLILRKKTNTGN